MGKPRPARCCGGFFIGPAARTSKARSPSGPIQETGDLPLEALKLDLQRLTEAHLETGRLIEKIARQIESYEEKDERRRKSGDLDGPVMGRA